MNTYGNGLELLGIGNPPINLEASLPVPGALLTGSIVGNITTTPNDNTSATPIVIGSTAMGPMSSNSLFELLPSVLSDFTAHAHPTMIVPESFASSGDNIITPAPTGEAEASSPTEVIVDSSMPKITIETTRPSTIGGVTVSGNERAFENPPQPLPLSTYGFSGGEVTISDERRTVGMLSSLPSIINSEEPSVTTDIPSPFQSSTTMKDETATPTTMTPDE